MRACRPIGLRPYVVYGPGRDQGMTSGPTMAMLAAVRGEPYHIGFSGSAQFDFVPDVARAAVTAAHAVTDAAGVYNVPGALADVAEVVACILTAVPGAEITWSGDPLPFPPALEAVGFDRDVGPFPRTTLADGVAATIAHFRRTPGQSEACHRRGRDSHAPTVAPPGPRLWGKTAPTSCQPRPRKAGGPASSGIFAIAGSAKRNPDLQTRPRLHGSRYGSSPRAVQANEREDREELADQEGGRHPEHGVERARRVTDRAEQKR